jgi:hypothetical protein
MFGSVARINLPDPRQEKAPEITVVAVEVAVEVAVVTVVAVLLAVDD